MTEVTTWSRLNRQSGKYEHNHIEDGHSKSDTPTQKSDFQKRMWKGGDWRKGHKSLVDGKIV